MATEGDRSDEQEPTTRIYDSYVTLVEAVASATHRDLLACPPLGDAVDPEALDALVTSDGHVSIEFGYAGCDVCVRNGLVSVYPR